ncbi:MAG TPA: beta-hexosaminidase, partial [Erythrobacter sp.]|nr:beta-hexosaminidase [Erythrobacter sp.]
VISEIIRKRIGFSGLLLSDDIDMQALDGTIAERSRRALAAGCDIVLNCWARMEDQQAIADLGKTMSDQSARRLERVHAAMHPPSDRPDTDELLAKRDALLALAEERAA